MRRVIASCLVALVLAGCQNPSPEYVEGTMTQIGAYLPLDGGLYGVEVVNYMNGCRLNVSSNQPFKVSRKYESKNNYFWGMVSTDEKTETETEANK